MFLTTFLAAGLAVLVGWFALQRMGAEAPPRTSPSTCWMKARGVLKDESLSSISPWAKLLERWDFMKIMRRHLQQADLSWSVGRFTMLMLLTGSVALAVAMREERIPGIGRGSDRGLVRLAALPVYRAPPRQTLSSV